MSETLAVPASLEQKNDFVRDLRNYFMQLYGTRHHFTGGGGDFVGKRIGEGVYVGAYRDSNEIEDFSGIRFRKDLCKSPFILNRYSLLDNVRKFAERYEGVECLVEKISDEEMGLTLRFGGDEYFVHPVITEGMEGEFGIEFLYNFVQRIAERFSEPT